MDGSNTSFLLGPDLFSGAFAVSFRAGILTNLRESITSGSRRMGYLRTYPKPKTNKWQAGKSPSFIADASSFVVVCTWSGQLLGVFPEGFHHGLRKNKSVGCLGGSLSPVVSLGDTPGMNPQAKQFFKWTDVW